jgi:uncharacterized protein (DUF1697 family)
MPRYIAFLRAINVGGHVVKMDRLRTFFAGLGFSGVETFIASGNVVFDTPKADAATLERRISRELAKELGYETAVFLRTPAEVAAVAALEPFGDLEGNSLYVAFLPGVPSEPARKALMTFRSEIDDFRVEGREVYWLCRGKMMDSRFSGALLEKTVGMPATARNITTVRKLAEKYKGGASSPSASPAASGRTARAAGATGAAGAAGAGGRGTRSSTRRR